MQTFIFYFSPAYIAATLLLTGVGHLVGFSRFQDLVRRQGVFPAPLSGLVSLAVLSLELALGGAALARLLGFIPAAAGILIFSVCAATSALFVLYLRRLLRAGSMAACGCTPFGGRLTPASLAPALGLLVASSLALATALATPSQQGSPIVAELGPLSIALPIAWGVALSGLVAVTPASYERASIGVPG